MAVTGTSRRQPGDCPAGRPALSASALSKRFGDRVAFRDVSFEIAYGEVFGFLGPNGAGKTTTVRTFGTLIAPTSGTATVAGPESPGLCPRLSVVENLECFCVQPLVAVFTLDPAASSALGQEHVLLYMLGIPALVPSFVAAYSVVGEREQGTLEPVLTTPIRREELLLLGKALGALLPSLAVAYVVYGLFLACVELAQQFAILASLPSIAVTTLVSAMFDRERLIIGSK